MKMIFSVICLSLFLLPVSVYAVETIREGLWEITTSFEMPGAKGKLPTTSIRHCYTKEEVKDHKNVVAAKNKDCVVTQQKVVGNRITWAMKCTGKNAGTFNGETVMNPESYQSVMQMKSQGHTMVMKINGKRIGKCK